MDNKKTNTSCNVVDVLKKHFFELSEMATMTNKPEQKMRLIECILKIYDALKY